jgi:galactokinase/mevalonate kinase-like predicted kinase
MRIELDTLIASNNQAHKTIEHEFEKETRLTFEFYTFEEEEVVLEQLERALTGKCSENTEFSDPMDELVCLFKDCVFEQEFRYLEETALML